MWESGENFSQALEAIALSMSAGLEAESNRCEAESAFERFLAMLEGGIVRAAAPDDAGVWRSQPLVKSIILLGFRLGRLEARSEAGFFFCDKHNLWPDLPDLAERGVRVVPGGSAVRRGVYMGRGVTIMPPAYVNIGAYVGDGTMIDSHALVGSCAQIGQRCHISAAAQIGGVLEPVGQLPVVIEDGCFVGGNCGIYEGAHLGEGAVLAAGTILTRSTRVYDLVHKAILEAHDGVLTIPAGAVVVPGSRPLKSAFAQDHGLSVYTPIIIKYRDAKTDAAMVLEEALRLHHG